MCTVDSSPCELAPASRREVARCSLVAATLLALSAATAACNLDFAQRPLDEAASGDDTTAADLRDDASDLSNTLPSDLGADDAPCVPSVTSCEGLGVACGTHTDDCGNALVCPECPGEHVCDAAGQCVLEFTPSSDARVPDTGTHLCVTWEGGGCPAPSEPFWGQDASYDVHRPSLQALDETVAFDAVTGLIWSRSGFNVALETVPDVCPAIAAASQQPWRTPTVSELLTVLDYGRRGPVVDTAIFGELTVVATDTFDLEGGRFFADLLTGAIYTAPPPANTYVICVQGDWPRRDWRVVSESVALDRSLALMWTRRVQSSRTWLEALAHCEGLELAGYGDWRMPTLQELGSLLESINGVTSPSAEVFDWSREEHLWSATPDGVRSDGTAEGSLVRTLRGDGDPEVAAPLESALGWLCVRDVR